MENANLILKANTHAIFQRGQCHFENTAHTMRDGRLVAAITHRRCAREYLAEKNASRQPGEAAFELMEIDAAWELVCQAQGEKYLSDWQEIDAERWGDMLEILPPEKWETVAGVEIFRMSERLTGNITAHFARIGERYFEANRRTSESYAEMAAQVARAAS